METGARRFSRLGAFPGLGSGQNAAERALGVDFQKRDRGGDVIISPTTLLMAALGTGVGAAIQSASDKGGWVKGAFSGLVSGMVLNQVLRFASREGY